MYPLSFLLTLSSCLIIVQHTIHASGSPILDLSSGSGAPLDIRSSSLSVFVDEGSLLEIYSLQNNALIDGSMVYVLNDSISQILYNGSLQIDDTGLALIPLPAHVNSITFTWLVNGEEEELPVVRYDIEVNEIGGESVLDSLQLSVPSSGYVNDSMEFSIIMSCSEDRGVSITSIGVQLNFTLYDTSVYFILQKQCDVIQPTSSIATSSDLLLTDITPSLTDITPSLTDITPSLTDITPSLIDITPSLTDITPSLTDILSSTVYGFSSSDLSKLSSTEILLTSSLISSSILSSLEIIPSSTEIKLSSTVIIPSSSELMFSSSQTIMESSSVISSLLNQISSTQMVSSVDSSSSEITSQTIEISMQSSEIPTQSNVISTQSSVSSTQFSEISIQSSEISMQSSEIPTQSSKIPTQSIEISSSSESLSSSVIIIVVPTITPTSSVIPTSPTTNLPWSLYAVVFGPLVGFLILCILIIVCCLCCIKCAKKKGSHGFSDDNNYVEPLYEDNFEDDDNADKYKKLEAPISIWTNLSWGSKTSLPLHIQTLVRTINIDRRKIAITNTFLKGTNGCLNKGMLMMDRINPSSDDNMGTIMKVMTGLDKGREDITRFIEHTTLLYGTEHINILPLLGLSIEDNCVPIAIYPLTEYGNLHFILEMCRLMPKENPLGPFKAETKINFSYQLSSAMKFLSDKKITLPDIALRNCWLDTNYTLKLSDSVLSQDFYPEAYANIKGAIRPVKWSAIETLQEGLITTQSNVWSYGVVVWEIFSTAKEPYGDIPNRSIVSHLMMDERLKYPSEDCPEQLYSLLLSCWNQRGEDRPRFSAIHETLKTLNRQYSPSHHARPHPHSTATRDSDPYTVTTFGKDLRSKPVSVTIEPESGGNFESSTPRHSGHAAPTNDSFVIIPRRHSGHKRTSDHTSSVASLGGGGKAEKISLSFSVLDNVSDGESGSESESEGGSFPSTLKSRVSLNASSTLTPKADTIGESLVTLQPATPTVPPTLLPRPDTATSTVGESTSNRSSILLPAPTCSTDRSSFYSTGIDSISTTFSTPQPHPLSHTPLGIEMRAYGVEGGVDRNGLPPQVMTTPFKSTDSGIRSDDDSSSSTASNHLPNSHVISPTSHVISPTSHVTSPTSHVTSPSSHVTPSNSHVTLPNSHVTTTPSEPSLSTSTNTGSVQLRNPRTEQLRNSSRTDSERLSFGTGFMDFSSDLMAAFDSFSTFKSS